MNIKAALLLLLACTASAADFYWRPYEGRTTGDGRSYETAFRGQPRWADMAPGDRILVCGTHPTQLTPTVDGITITGECPQEAGAIRLSGVGEPIVLRDRHSVTVSDLVIERCWSGVTIERGGGHRLERLTIRDCAGYGVRAMAGDSADVVLSDSTIERVGNGVYLVGRQHSGWRIVGNRIADVSGAKDAHGVGVQSCRDCEVSKNWIERANSGITLYRLSGGDLTDVRVAGNVIRQMTGVPGSTGLNRGVEVTSANCVPDPERTRNVVIDGNRFSQIADAAVYVKVAAPEAAEAWPVVVTGNTADRVATGLLWGAVRPTAGQVPWFPAFGNGWTVRRTSFVPNCVDVP